MKTLSLKLENNIFEDVEELTNSMKLARNRYINEAVEFYNNYNKRRLLKAQFEKEQSLIGEDSLEITHEFEALEDELPEY
jgi:hypothetical protein